MPRGFTVIEVVVIMVIIAILAAVALTRFSSFETIKLNGAVRKIVSDIRYTRKLAISTQKRAGLTFNTNGYSVYEDITVPTLAESPGEPCSTDSSNKFVVDFTADRCSSYEGVTLSYSAATVAFDSLGSPVDASGSPLDTQTVTVTLNIAKTITIEAGTGRVGY
jgi:MSHA pilin protein MshC